MAYSLNWDLDPIYPGGITSPEFAAKLTLLDEQIKQFAADVTAYDRFTDTDFSQFIALVDAAQTIRSGLGTVALFVNALYSADYTNPVYRPYQTKVSQLDVAYQAPLNAFAKLLTSFDDDTFAKVLTLPGVNDVAFHLNELRDDASRLLDDRAEELLNNLRLDGLQAWSEHYDTISAGLSMTYTDENGAEQALSAGQALNQLDGYP